MAWLYLLCGSLCEIGWPWLVKTHGLKWSITTLGALLLMLGGPILFSLAIKTLPVGIAYVVFVGLNTTAVLCGSVFLFGETFTLPQLFCVAMIVGGIIGLRLLENPA